jgi:hypothetical protein
MKFLSSHGYTNMFLKNTSDGKEKFLWEIGG